MLGRRTVHALLAAALVLSLAACQPTGVPVCDGTGWALLQAEAFGYVFDCTPDLPGAPANVLGFADHPNRVLYVWPDRMPPVVVPKIMWHELGHVAWDRQGRSGSQAAEETWADGYAWCKQPIPVVSFRSRPTWWECPDYLKDAT
jgi:hypothetical protein